MNKKGFTLLEVLVIIVLLGVLSSVIIPSAFKVIQDSKNRSYRTLIDTIENNANLYISDHRDDIETAISSTGSYDLTLDDLVDEGLLKAPIINPKTDKAIPLTKKVTIKLDEDGVYQICYEDNEACSSLENNAVIAFGTNGNSTYAKSRSTSVTVTDNLGVNEASLKYLWTKSSSEITESVMNANGTSFTNGATINSPIGITGRYYLWILAKNNSADVTIKRTNAFYLDNATPTIIFGTNGNSTYAKSRSTSVTISDAYSGINSSSLKYLWSQSSSGITESDINTSGTTLTSESVINSPAGVTGGYYLWILAKDNVNNTAVIKTNVFNLDNTKPVITMSGSSPVTINVGSTYTDAGATATDNIDGNITISIQKTSKVTPSAVGIYTVTYNVVTN
jgi:prepilin-type N-terminal cleavage/methylation domain-containing protein